MVRFLVTILLLGIGLHSEAQTIAVESFDYPASAPLIGQGSTTDGWGGPWVGIDGTTVGSTTTDTLLIPALSVRSELPVAYLPSGMHHAIQRPFAQSLNGEFWFSFLSRQNGELFAKATLAFVDTSAPNTEQVRIEVGKTYAATDLVSDGIFRYPRSTGALYPNGHWTVGRFFTESDTTLLLHLWIDPDPTTEPDTSLSDARRSFPLASFDALRLCALDRPGLNWWVDDIYLGQQFADVVPPDWTPVVISDNRIPAREGFDYTVGDLLVNRNGGHGFAAPWEDRNNFNHQISDQSLDFGNALNTEAPVAGLFHQGNGTNNRYVRRLATPYPDDGSVYWFGAVLDMEFSNNGNVAQVFLADADQLGPSGPAGQLLLMGKTFQNDRFSLGASGNFSSLDEVPVVGSRWAVVKIATTGNTQPETVQLWLDPDPTLDEPPLNEVVLTKSIALNNGWNALGVKIEGSAGVSLLLDELALGTDYRNVVPPYLTQLPQLALLQEWTIYPNPGDGTINFDKLPEGTRNILVYRADGSFMENVSVEKFSNTLSPTLPPGVYFLIFESDSENYFSKYVKQ